MVGDSITWAQEGDRWRESLLTHIPRLAFVGTHSGMLGYSHAGEGGNSTRNVLGRMGDIPDCPYYSLLIGTNDNNVKDAQVIEEHAQGTADRIVQIVNGLLGKPSVQKVFLGSILPCHTDNPLRDQTNHATNLALRDRLGSSLPADKVVWVEYERPVREIPGWEPMIRLHPTREGYAVIARILADTISQALNVTDPAADPVAAGPAAVRVENLCQGTETREPVIAGWYMLSFDVTATGDAEGTVSLQGLGAKAPQEPIGAFTIPREAAGKRLSFAFFTGYEGYGYTRCRLAVVADGCSIGRTMIEKRRPSGKASVYGEDSFLDAESQITPGELMERDEPGRGQ